MPVIDHRHRIVDMAARRPTGTPTPAPPKPLITLEEWEAKAPLGDLESQSVNLLKAASERAARPVKVRVVNLGFAFYRLELFTKIS